MTSGAELRRGLVADLRKSGDLRSPGWASAVEAVPRNVFLGKRVYRQTPDGSWEPFDRADVEPGTWLELAYRNETLVTQIEGRGDHEGPVVGSPTSSSTLPGLVVRMLEDAAIGEGDRVLEIGTGTGYSTALLCNRLGAENVTSVEVDPGVSGRAAAALHALGYWPALVTGDGLRGHPDGAPYDRIIATCSVRTIPRAWLEQTRPGGQILVTLSGWLYGSGLVLLDVHSAGRATGRFLPGTVSFMIARPHAAPPIDVHPPREGETRTSGRGGVVFGDWMTSFLAQLAAPNTRGMGEFVDGADGPMTELLHDHATGSYAWITPAGDGKWSVTQGGPLRLWDDIEAALDTWQTAGSPDQSEFRLTVEPDGQTVAVGASQWRLPE